VITPVTVTITRLESSHTAPMLEHGHNKESITLHDEQRKVIIPQRRNIRMHQDFNDENGRRTDGEPNL
jgi:hypothetical protein